MSPTGSRQRQRAAEKARRRSLRRRRIALVAAVAVVSLALAIALSGVFGGGDDPLADDPGETPETTEPGLKEDAYLIRITDDGQTGAAVLVTEADPTAMLGMPGATLVRGPLGFVPLSEAWVDDDPSAAVEGLATLTGFEPAHTASVEWGSVLQALAAGGSEAEFPADLEPALADTGSQVVEALATLGTDASGVSALEELMVADEGGSPAEAVNAVVGGQGIVAGLPGRQVEGLDYRYFEPDVDGITRLLGGSPPEESVSVEVQNGSGIVGIAQRISELVAPLGYTMLPPKNAEGFPDVETTQIHAGSAVVGEADRIRGVLGLGKVVQQDGLSPTQIIVIIGKDLDPEALPAPEGG